MSLSVKVSEIEGAAARLATSVKPNESASLFGVNGKTEGVPSVRVALSLEEIGVVDDGAPRTTFGLLARR